MAQPQASPQAGLAASPAREEPGVLDKIMGGIRKSDGLLTSIGMGLMTTPGLGPAVGVGLAHHQQAQKGRVATDLAQAELALKQRKLAQETGALQGNAAIVKRAFPDLSDAEALSAGSNSSLVTEALKIVRDPNHGRDSDPSLIRARAQAQAEGAAAGQPQDVLPAGAGRCRQRVERERPHRSAYGRAPGEGRQAATRRDRRRRWDDAHEGPHRSRRRREPGRRALQPARWNDDQQHGGRKGAGCDRRQGLRRVSARSRHEGPERRLDAQTRWR